MKCFIQSESASLVRIRNKRTVFMMIFPQCFGVGKMKLRPEFSLLILNIKLRNQDWCFT